MGKTVAVIGAGISGLTVAYEILERGRRAADPAGVVCLEASSRPGGNIRTERAEGYVCEWGPNGFLDNVPATPALVRRLGLDDRVQKADEQSALRYIYRAGRLRSVPTTPPAFLRSDILPWPARLRILWEPLARRRPEGRDESVYEFAARRIGPEAARVLVGAMVTGVYAGDVHRLCLRSTFPKMWQMETDHGGLFRAMLAKRKVARAAGTSAGGPAGPGGTLTSFRTGLQELTDRLAEAIGSSLRLSTPVIAVSDLGRRGYRVHLEHGAPLDVDAVVVSAPSFDAAAAVAEMDPELSVTMREIPSAPLAVVHLGFSEAKLGIPPRGFGFLVPRGEGPRILGTLWSSNIFPGRAPSGKFLMTSMIGGANDPEALDLDDRALIRVVRQDLRTCTAVETEPEFERVFRHPRGIPQYTVGHQQRLRSIDRRLAEHPGLHVAGNSYHGISVNLCVDEAPRVADAVLAGLGNGAAVA